MKIILTGGTGYIGAALRQELLAHGHSVRLLVRKQSLGKVGKSEGCEVFPGDILDTHACLAAVDGMDVLINLIGIRREYPEQGTTYEALHTDATSYITTAAAQSGVKRVVQMSGLGARAGAASRYHQTKWEAEEIVRKSGMRWTIFRPSIVFDRTDTFHPLMLELALRPVVPLVKSGKALLQPVALTNLVEAMARTVSMPETQGRVFEVGGPDRISLREIIDALSDKLKIQPNIVSAPSFLMKQMVKMLQGIKGFPLTYDELLMLLEDNVCDSEDFTSTFGIKLDSYREALPHLLLALAPAKSA